jgi:hypothetical protein
MNNTMHNSLLWNKKSCRVLKIFFLAFPWIVLAAMIVKSPPRLLHDEGYQIGLARLVNKIGLLPALVSPDNPSAVGALYAIIHATLSPITHFDAPDIRWINFFLSALVLILVSSSIHQLQWEKILYVGFTMLSVPFLWPCIGLALTEVPALTAFAAGTFFFSRIDFANRSPRDSFFALLGGIAWGIAIVGRQNYLVLIPCLVLWGLLFTNCRWFALFGVLGCVLSSFWMFAIWKGLVPQSHQTVLDSEGVVMSHAVYGAVLVGLAGFIISPNFVKIIPIKANFVILCASAFLMWFHANPVETPIPARGVLSMLIGEKIISLFLWPLMTLLMAISASWIISSVVLCFQKKNRFIWLNIIILFSFILMPAKIPHVFSSRYLVCAIVPLLILSTSVGEKPGILPVITKVAGIIIGSATLYSYYLLN